MRTVPASYEILACPTDAEMLSNIERAARTCYKTEYKIGEGSAEALVKYLLNRGHMAMIEFGGQVVVRFISNRGFTHELVRHRMASFAQESTRYCNYTRARFGHEITYIDLAGMMEKRIKNAEKRAKYTAHLLDTWLYCEERYMELVNEGCPPEIAREGLPLGVKAEIVISANVREWRHIFDQRCSPKAHPRMREVMVPLLKELAERCPILFERIEPLT